MLTLDQARLIDAAGERRGRLVIAGGKIITAGESEDPPIGRVLDTSGLTVTPAFIDVHTHGGGGFNLHTTDPREINRYAEWVPSTGVGSFLITIVGTPGGLPEAEIRAAVSAIEAGGSGAEPLGIHLEGPYLNKGRRGTHDSAWLRLPDPGETERLLEIAGKHLRLITLAPELPGAGALIDRLVEAGVTVSIGHTVASYDETQAAISRGVRHATHCFNAMPPLHHRAPGPLGAILEAPEVRGELIGDGVHVHPAAMRMLIRALGPDRTIIITDALAAAGMSDISFTFNGQEAHIEGGVARLSDGTMTGSILTMDQALRNLTALGEVSEADTIRMLTINPAQAAQVGDRKGLLQPGCDADLVLLDDQQTVHATFCHGALAYLSDTLRNRWGDLVSDLV